MSIVQRVSYRYHMNWLLGALVGYIVHDAVQPTVVGQVLDKVALPADLFVEPKGEDNA